MIFCEALSNKAFSTPLNSLPIPAVGPSVRLLSRSPGSVNFPRRLLDLDEKNDGTVSNGGERRVRGRRGREGRGAHDCIIRLNRLEKNKYKVCQASFLPTPHRARPPVSPTTGRQAGPANPRSVCRPHWRVGWLVVGYDHPHGGNGRRPTCNPSEAGSPPLCLSSRSVVLAGALFRHANYALWSCSRIEETRNEMHEEGRRRSGVEGEERRVNISVEQKNERKRGRRREHTNAKPWRAVYLSH